MAKRKKRSKVQKRGKLRRGNSAKRGKAHKASRAKTVAKAKPKRLHHWPSGGHGTHGANENWSKKKETVRLAVHDGTDWARFGKIYRQPKRLPGQLRAVVMQLESNERLWNRAGQLAQPPIRYF